MCLSFAVSAMYVILHFRFFVGRRLRISEHLGMADWNPPGSAVVMREKRHCTHLFTQSISHARVERCDGLKIDMCAHWLTDYGGVLHGGGHWLITGVQQQQSNDGHTDTLHTLLCSAASSCHLIIASTQHRGGVGVCRSQIKLDADNHLPQASFYVTVLPAGCLYDRIKLLKVFGRQSTAASEMAIWYFSEPKIPWSNHGSFATE